MRPHRDFLDGRSGDTVSVMRLPDEQHQLGIRHLAIGHDGTVAVALQYEGPSGDLVPLVCLHRPGAPALEPLGLPEAMLRDMRHYSRRADVHAKGTVLAAPGRASFGGIVCRTGLVLGVAGH